MEIVAIQVVQFLQVQNFHKYYSLKFLILIK
jgi:hypothetical protein